MNAPLPAAVGEIERRISMSDYLSIKALSSGMCQTILSQSPLHAWHDSPWNPDREDDSPDTANIGKLAHACLLEGGTDNCRVFDPSQFPNAKGGGVATGWTNKAIRDAKAASIAASEIPLLISDFAAVQRMVKAVQTFIAGSELRGIFDKGESEVTMLFEIDGVPCKARADRISADKRINLSYKTVGRTANPDPWIRTQLPGLDVAAVFYEAAVRAAYGVEDVTTVHLIQEQEPPHACSLVALAPPYRALAEHRLSVAVATWKECLKTGVYRAYSPRIHYAEPKPWQQAEAEEREINTAFSNDELDGGIPL